MTDLFILDLLPVLLLAAAIILVIYLRSHSRREISAADKEIGHFSENFRKIFFSVLSEVIASDDQDKSLSAIANGVMRTFGANVFIFGRTGESAGLLCHAANDLDRISNLLVKIGIRLDVGAIPLRGGRAKVFAGGYAEFEDPFPLIGDLATSAACRKIQNELKFDSISTISVKTESGDYLILLILPARTNDARSFITQFGALLEFAIYLSNLKKKLSEFEKRFDEQLIKAKNEFIEKEGAHLRLYDDMPIPAAVLDDSGIITEANRALKDLFGKKIEAIGQPFSSIMDEEGRQNFVETLLNLKIRKEDNFPLVIAGEYFRARIFEVDDKNQVVVYLLDETAGVNLRVELERTVDALRKENELAERLIAEEKKHSGEIIRNSVVPAIAVLGDKIEFPSESIKRIFSVSDGQSLEEFCSRNEIATLSTSEPSFEIKASGGRTFFVSQWGSGRNRYYAFNDFTELRKVEEDLRRSSVELEKLFNGVLPTARVREKKIVEWNNSFEALLKDFLETEKSLDGFLRYLGESAEAVKSELMSNSIVTRTCRTTDRKSLNVCLSSAEDSIFIFLEDITEQENLRQQLRNTQNVLANSIEFFSEEPIFVLENGSVSAANLAARNKLNIKLDESLDVDSLFASVGATDYDGIVELAGRFFKIESATLNNLTVFHFRQVTEEIAQRAEISKLKRRHDLLRELSNSERYENILTNLKEIIGEDIPLKLLCTGILYTARESADVYLLTVSTDKIEPSLSLSLSPADISVAEHGGIFSPNGSLGDKAELPDTTFSNIISSGDSELVIESTCVGDVHGFASVASVGSSIRPSTGQDDVVANRVIDEISKVLKVASSTAVDIYTRSSAQKKFEESGRVTRALVGLTGIGEGSFDEVSRRTVDLLKQVFGADSIGVYSVDGPRLTLSFVNGTLPSTVSLPRIRFGVMVPATQLATDADLVKGSEVISSDGVYFSLRSRQQSLALMFKFVGMPPALSDLNAVSSIALDLLESKRAMETHARTASSLSDESKSVNDFITKISKASTPQDVIKILGDSLVERYKGSSISVTTDGNAQSSARPLEVARKEEGELAIYEANFLNFGIGAIAIKTSIDLFSQTMVDIAVDKLRSFLALKLPMAQNESAELQIRLDKLKSDLSSLRDSVDKIPASLRNARIEIDGVLSRLPFVQGDEKIIQEIKMRLASAAKELSMDLDSSYTNQDAIFENIRESVMEQEASVKRIKNFDISVLTDFRAESSIASLIKDIFVNFIITAEIPDCEVLMMTVQPSPNELNAGKGKHIGIRLTSKETVAPGEDKVRQSETMQTLVNKIERMGYQVDTRALGSELMMDICEIKKVEAPKGESAILVEDDRALLEEESHDILQIFSHLKVAGDAVEAEKIFESEKFAAAFVDLSLPSINGKELCQQIKKAQPACVTILLTNREGEEKAAGVDHIVVRPLTEESVRNLVGK
jgi:PAS domain-containing protein/CheY-like chemotaxis protein